MAVIEIYSGPECGYCKQAKALLDERGLAYTDYDIAADAGRREELLKRLPRVRTIPQIFVDGEHVGGYEDLEHLDRTGRLAELVDGAR